MQLLAGLAVRQGQTLAPGWGQGQGHGPGQALAWWEVVREEGAVVAKAMAMAMVAAVVAGAEWGWAAAVVLAGTAWWRVGGGVGMQVVASRVVGATFGARGRQTRRWPA